MLPVDGYDKGDDTDEVHNEAGLHHVHRLHAAVPEHWGRVTSLSYGEVTETVNVSQVAGKKFYHLLRRNSKLWNSRLWNPRVVKSECC